MKGNHTSVSSSHHNSIELINIITILVNAGRKKKKTNSSSSTKLRKDFRMGRDLEINQPCGVQNAWWIHGGSGSLGP